MSRFTANLFPEVMAGIPLAWALYYKSNGIEHRRKDVRLEGI